MQFEVYKNGNNDYYIDYYVAVAFGVGELLETYVIGTRTFVKANEKDINSIIEISKATNTTYEPVYFNLNIPAIKAKSEVQFEIYKDDETYYIDYYVAVAFGTKINENRIQLGNREFVKVTREDIDRIIEISKLTDTTYIPVTFKLYKNNKNEAVEFEVYQKDDSFLVDYIVAVSFGVGNPANLEKIGNRTFVRISKAELDSIIDHSNKTNTPYVPHFFNALNTKQVAKLLVYRDEDNNLFIASNAADVLGIKILCLENIRPNELHSKITEEELQKIINDGKANGIEIQPEFVELKHKQNETNNIVVILNTSNRLFMPANICEQYSLGNREVSIKVDNILYFETNDEEIDELGNKGNKVLIKKHQDLPLDVKPTNKDYAVLEAYKNIEDSTLYLEDGVCVFANIGNRTDATFINGKRCYQINENELEIAANILNALSVIKYFETEKTEVHREENGRETITVYSAKSGLYLEERLCDTLNILSDKEKVIDNKKYYRINKGTVDRLSNRYELVYETIPQKTARFIACTLDDNLYIEEYIANLFKFHSIGPKVRIEGKIYYQVTKEQIESIVTITNNLDTKLVPLIKEIQLKKETSGERNPIFSEDDYSDELLPGTNIYRPREKREGETPEEYESFLTNYYLTFFPKANLKDGEEQTTIKR